MNICGRYDRLAMLNLYLDKPVFSLIISSSRPESPGGRCLESVLAQTFPDFEAICIAESTDKAEAEMPDVKDPRIAIRQHNGGNAFNEGLRHARGEYVLFMNAADLCEPDLLDLVYGEILKTHGDLILFNDDAPKHEPLEEPTANGYMLDLRQENLKSSKFKYVNCMAMACKKKFIYENRLFHQEIFAFGKKFFCMTALLLANEISFIDKILVHPGSGDLSAPNHFVKLLYLIKIFIKEKYFCENFGGDYFYHMENAVNKYKTILSSEEEENLDILIKNYKILTLQN